MGPPFFKGKLSSLFEKVVSFVAEQRAEPANKISPTTRLWQDLRLAGDEADEFFVDFGKTFGIDLSGLDLSKYFPSEFAVTWCWLGSKLGFFPERQFPPITIVYLVEAAEAKSWMFQDQCRDTKNE